MAGRTAQAAVCIVRVEPQPGHLLISVTTNRSLNRELYSASVEPTRKYSDPEAALQAVADFLHSFRT
ncbi:hypothetical protein [Jatrophihabitans sp.]|uniref:hypothetical protein n=1 Tax=Jatrophihabitans sp. TaxID=1932789 RepID=UPI002C8A449A|nr:hypothetical protein [Jatrophihabitans sp.]